MAYKRIAVIGGGPSGLAIAKALSLEPSGFETIDLFERRDRVGGVWFYGGDKSKYKPSIPSADLNGAIEHHESKESENNGKSLYFSPMYKFLETNLSSKLMEFTDVELPQGTPVFASRELYLEYLEQYVKTISSDVKIHLQTEAVQLSKKLGTWELTTNHNGSEKVSYYDAIVVANGHFNVSYIPEVPGISQWSQFAQGSVNHSRYFDDPADYKGLNVLIVGNFSSGSDIATQLSASAKNVYVSTSETPLPQDKSVIKYVGIVSKYDYNDERSFITEDGTRVTGIDRILFCTGYLYRVPFLEKYLPGLAPTGSHIHDIYKQLFYIYDTSLTLAALNKNVAPIPLAEAQGALIARVYSGRLALPDLEEMESDYQQELVTNGCGKSFHDLSFPRDVDYCKELQQIVIDNNLHHDGFVAAEWDDARVALRGNAKIQKKARQVIIEKNTVRLRSENKPFALAPI